MALLAQYRTVPPIEALIHKIEHSTDEPNWQNALANELFHFYFPPSAGWTILPRRGRADRHAGVVLRVGKWGPRPVPGPSTAQNPNPNPAFEDRVVAIVRKGDAYNRSALKREVKALHDSGVIESRVHWAALFMGRHVWFYICERKAEGELGWEAFGPPMQMGRSIFDVREESLAVEEMMRYMAYR